MTAKPAKDRAAAQINFRLPVPLVQWLIEEAQRRGVTQTAVVIEALEKMRDNKRPML